MNLAKMFETQKVLDEKIYERFPGLKEEDWDWKITALLVELGECANEHRGFKRWSENQKPNPTGYIECDLCTDSPGVYEVIHEGKILSFTCQKCEGHEEIYVGDRLLEEFVDCIHFFISIAIELKMFPNDLQVCENHTEPTIEATFNKLFSEVASISVLKGIGIPARVTLEDLQETWYMAFSCFVGIGEQFFDFTWKQIETAYFEKNKINHERQNNGY